MTVATLDTVDTVRAQLRDLDRPLTYRERALLMAAVMRHDGRDRDVVELLDTARRAVRYRLRATHTAPAPEVAALLAAVDAILDPPVDPAQPTIPSPQPDRRFRRDVDG